MQEVGRACEMATRALSAGVARGGSRALARRAARAPFNTYYYAYGSIITRTFGGACLWLIASYRVDVH